MLAEEQDPGYSFLILFGPFFLTIPSSDKDGEVYDLKG